MSRGMYVCMLTVLLCTCIYFLLFDAGCFGIIDLVIYTATTIPRANSPNLATACPYERSYNAKYTKFLLIKWIS